MEDIIYRYTKTHPNLFNTIFNLKQNLKGGLIKNFPKIYNQKRLEDFPINIQIQTTSICNSRCLMCPYRLVWKKMEQGNMKDSLYKKIIDECSEHKISKIVPFLMAEPLIDNKLFQRIKYAKEKIPDTKIIISTNGAALTKKKAKELANSPIDMITFNAQGINKESYERIMKGLNFERTMENIEYYLSLDKKCDSFLKFELLIGAIPKDEVEEFKNYWQEKGLFVEIHRMHDRADNLNSDVSLDETDLDFGRKSFSKVYGCKQDRHLKWIHVLFNGDVVLCCQDWKREVVLGNVKDDSIKNIWKSKRYEKVRKMVSSEINSSEKFICKRCFFAVGKN